MGCVLEFKTATIAVADCVAGNVREDRSVAW